MANTFMASGLALTPAATPTDIITISGAANMLVRVINLRAHIHTSSATLVLGHFIKRSSANSGGTSSAATAISLDSGREGSRATVRTYTANPASLGDAVGTLGTQYLTTLIPTSVPGVMQLTSLGTLQNVTAGNESYLRPVSLRGASELLALNWNGAALATGFIFAAWDVVWTEEYA